MGYLSAYRRTWTLLLSVGVLVISAARIAHADSNSADEKMEVGVLRFETFGDDAELVANRMRPAVERAMNAAGYEVHWLNEQDVTDCPRDNACLSDLGTRFGLKRFARIRIETSGDGLLTYLFNVTLLAVDQPDPLVARGEPECVACSERQAEGELKSAWKVIAEADATLRGTHGKTGSAAAHTRSRFGAWKWITLVGGLGVAGAGGYLIALDGRSRDCQNNSCASTYESLVPGIAVAGIGAGIIGVSIYMFATDKRKVVEHARFQPIRGGAVVGWAGTF